jgi:hypothetical protein
MKFAVPFALIASMVIGVRAIAPLVNLSKSEVWLELDTDKLKGRPAQLAWSDSENELYLQVVEGTTVETLKVRHYMLARDRAPAEIDDQPEWAKTYWRWKSAKSYFGDPLMTIELDTRREIVESMQERNTSYLNSEVHAPATLESKATGGTRVINRLMLKGQIIGEFIDEQVFSGYTFSWSPRLLGLIAFRARNGHLTIMNVDGQTDVVKDAKDVWLPAWSESGDLIAYLDREGRKKFSLKVISTL